MRTSFFLILLLYSFTALGQIDLQKPFKDCNLKGSTTIYDYKSKRWIFSDSLDATKQTLPASTFKIINLLIALEAGVIKNEYDTVKWKGKTDTALYGYRPEIYKDMTVKEAFEVSAGWVFIELAKKVGRIRYKHYLEICQYGNGNVSEQGTDFWNFGAFAVSPINQIQFLLNVYEETTPFSKRNVAILKRVMMTEKTGTYTIRSKTGWTRVLEKDWGWWIGYVERKNNTYFFATRVSKDLATVNPDFGPCRKEITKNILKQLRAIE